MSRFHVLSIVLTTSIAFSLTLLTAAAFVDWTAERVALWRDRR